MEYICPKCGSENVYFSKKKQIYICEECDSTFQVKQQVQAQRIFFSYGHDLNEPLILMIKKDLEDRGHVIWIDKTEIRGGDDWRRKITDGLLNTSAVISFLSTYSVRNPGVCLDELKIALCVKHGYIKTVLLEAEEEVKVPTTVSDVQWLDLSDWKEYYSQGGEIWEAWYKSKFEEICEIVESEDAKSFNGEIQTLKEILSPNLIDTKEHYLLQQQYVGRKWLSDMVEEWSGLSDGSRAFVLIAGPGIGKSCFAANLLHYHPDVLCGLFCEWDKPQTVHTKTVIKTIAFRLASKLKDYRKLLLNFLSEEASQKALEEKTPEELFSLLLCNPLNSLINGNRKKCLIVIDGLDEAATAEGDKLMRILADNLKLLPSWVKFILTSRPEHGVENIFKEYSPTIMQPNHLMNFNDIREYLALNLCEELAAFEDKIEVLNKILNSSEGSFLYASLFVQGVKSGTLSLLQCDKYPAGLSGFYYHNFHRNYSDTGEYKKVRNLVELIVAAKLFPIDLLPYFDIDSYEYVDVQRRFGSLLAEVPVHVSDVGSISCVTFSHKSMLDWLTDREKSCEFYVDVKKGAQRLAKTLTAALSNYGLAKLYAEEINQKNLLYKYIEQSLTSYYVNGQLWDMLEDFLVDSQTPFLPYWKSLPEFPEAWDLSLLVSRLKNDAQSVEYFKFLQNAGEIKMALKLLDKLSDEYSVSKMSLQHFKIYTDLVHLSGEYERAVHLNEEFLCQYSLQDIISNKELLSLKTRMLHHSKFFKPADALQEQIDSLIHMIDAAQNCEAYLELLIMGGNLGTLMGDLEYAEACNEKALDLAKENKKTNYELRAIRKKIDLLKCRQKFDEALSLLNQYITIHAEPESRYEVYLLCSLGELYRYKKDFDNAYLCYERVKSITAERGIWGWWAHSALAMGCLMYDYAHFKEAKTYFCSALEKYKQIGQLWGILTTEIYLLSLKRKEGMQVLDAEIKSMEETVDALHYASFKPYLEQLKQKFDIAFMPLMFI